MLTSLAENELRGGLGFIGRPWGVERRARFYEQERDGPGAVAERAGASAHGRWFPAATVAHPTACRTPFTTCCRRSRTCWHGGLGRHQSNGSRCCARPAERTWGAACAGPQPVGGLRHAVPGRARAVRRAARQLLAAACGTGWSARWPNCWKRTTTRWPGDRRHGEPTARTDQRSRAPPSSQRPAPSAASAHLRAERSHFVAIVAGFFRCSRPELSSSAPTGAAGRRDFWSVGTPATAAADDGSATNAAGPHHVAATTTERLQSIQRMVADQMGDKLPRLPRPTRCAPDSRAGGRALPHLGRLVHQARLDVPDRLRVHIAQFARIAEAGVADQVEPSDGGISFRVAPPAARAHATVRSRAVLTLLHALCAARAAAGLDRARLADDLAPAVWRRCRAWRCRAWSNCFRLLRAARRLPGSGDQRGLQRQPAAPEAETTHVAPHPLNQAVIAQALHDRNELKTATLQGHGLRRGRTGCAQSVPNSVSMLVNATVSCWCSVSVNHQARCSNGAEPGA